MPTRQGWTVAVAAFLAVAVGRVFGILELFVIGAGLGAAVVWSVLVVRLLRPHLRVTRWVHPTMLTVGDQGRVDLAIENRRGIPAPRVELSEPVGTVNTAKLAIASLRAHGSVNAGYRVPAPRRGLLTIGPTTLTRRDLLGLAVDHRLAAPAVDVVVAPQTFDVAMPSLGHGVLGRHLLALAQRTSLGEFHSLRDYAPGDEPRSIHWKASARSLDLKVRQHEAQGVRRCIVVLDRDAAAYPTDDDGAHESFERAISIAGSLALSADRTGLTTRFVTGGGLDLRGPDVSTHALQRLAEIDLGPPVAEIERDPGEGLGLVIVVTSSPESASWRRSDRIVDPTLTRVGVFTDPGHHRLGPLMVDARSLPAFRDHWAGLAGRRGLVRELTNTGATA